MTALTDAVAAVKAVPHGERTAKVNELMAGTVEPAALHWRALFVTALRLAEVWPQGCVWMTDEQLLTLAAAGDAEAVSGVVERFTPLALAVARGFFVPGGDRDDVRQEALIGVWRAIPYWRDGHGTSGKSFIAMCVRRQLITAVKMATAAKHQSLSHAARNVRDTAGEVFLVEQVIEDHGADPLEVLIRREAIAEVSDQLRDLSPLETRAVLGVANGITYEGIAGATESATVKSVDNALVRARQKLSHDTPASSKRRYPCPTCAGSTVKRVEGSRGRPPRCNVCRARDELKVAA